MKCSGQDKMSGKEYRMRVTLRVKQLLDCPLENRSVSVRLIWGNNSFWGGKKDQTSSRRCKNRKITWNETEESFDYESKVYLGSSRPTDDVSRDRLFKRQPSSARLSLSVAKNCNMKFLEMRKNPNSNLQNRYGMNQIVFSDITNGMAIYKVIFCVRHRKFGAIPFISLFF